MLGTEVLWLRSYVETDEPIKKMGSPQKPLPPRKSASDYNDYEHNPWRHFVTRYEWTKPSFRKYLDSTCSCTAFSKPVLPLLHLRGGRCSN